MKSHSLILFFLNTQKLRRLGNIGNGACVNMYAPETRKPLHKPTVQLVTSPLFSHMRLTCVNSWLADIPKLLRLEPSSVRLRTFKSRGHLVSELQRSQQWCEKNVSDHSGISIANFFGRSSWSGHNRQSLLTTMNSIYAAAFCLIGERTRLN